MLNTAAAIGISTGAVQSIKVMLRQLGRPALGIVLVQHIPESFAALFAADVKTV